MAVYTEISDAELVNFIADYEIGDVLDCKGIAEGTENSNFALTTTKGRYILTLYENRVTLDDLPFFLGLMNHLAASGVPCPIPVNGRDGEALRSLSGRPAAIVSFLEGVWPRSINPDHCYQLGQALASLHLSCESFPMSRENDLSVTSWRPLLEKCYQKPLGDHPRSIGIEVCDALEPELLGELSYLEANWPEGLPAGIIHADLFPDNVFFRNGNISGLIDYYFSCTDTLSYDLAICLNAWCFDAEQKFLPLFSQALLAGYQNVRRLSLDEQTAFPILCRGAALRFALTRLYDWLHVPEGTLGARKDPMEYIHKLHFHQSADYLRDYKMDITL